jgi:uncharacterized protein
MELPKMDSLLIALINIRKPWLLALMLLAMPARAFDVPELIPNVVDEAHVLSSQQVSELNQTIAQLREQSHIYAAVLLVDTTDTDAIEQAATKTFDQWQLGQARADNGLLIIAAIHDRRMRIEVGYGLEGSIPDVQASRIIRDVMAPAFKQGDYFLGIDGALKAANDLVLHSDSIQVQSEASQSSPTTSPWMLVWIWVVMIIVFPMLVRALGVWRASRYGDELQPTLQERSWPRVMFVSGPSVFLTLFLLINPGIFFVMGSIFAAPLFIGFAYIFLLVVNGGYLAMYTEKWRREFKGKPQPRHRSNQAERQAFGSGWSSGSASSSSSSSSGSSDSSSSSSSGGGSSGGGGASGSW